MAKPHCGINFIVVELVSGGDGQWYGEIIGKTSTRERAEEILRRAKRTPGHRFEIGEVSYG